MVTMNSSLQIQKLLAFSEEFNEFQELDILIESPFIRVNFEGEGIKQVFLGLSPLVLLIAEQRLLDYKINPGVVFGSSADPEIEGLELIKVLPLSKIKLQCVEPFKIVVTSQHKPSLYFELCNTRLSEKAQDRVWAEWVDLIKRIRRGIPLVNRPPRTDEVVKIPIYTLYTSDDGYDGDLRGGRDGSFHQLHQLIRSYDTLSKYRGHAYSDTISESLSMFDDTSHALNNSHKQGMNVAATAGRKTTTESNDLKPSIASAPCDGIKNCDIVQICQDTNLHLSSSLNVNNGANYNQFTESETSMEQHTSKGELKSPSKARSKSYRNSSMAPRESSKYMPFPYDMLPQEVNASASTAENHLEKSAVKHLSRDSHSTGRRFVRSSSIMVKSGGKEVSALDISRSKGHIHVGEKEVMEAGYRENLNIFSTSHRRNSANGESVDDVIGTWKAYIPTLPEYNNEGVRKFTSKRAKQKSTKEIMEQKFGSLAFDADSRLTRQVNHSKSKNKPAKHSRGKEKYEDSTSTDVDHISLQLTDHPSYTFDGDEHFKSNVLETEDAPVRSKSCSPKQLRQEPPTEASYSQEINLSDGIVVPHSWTPFSYDTSYHPDPPIPVIPYSYVLYNPQSNTAFEQVQPVIDSGLPFANTSAILEVNTLNTEEIGNSHTTSTSALHGTWFNNNNCPQYQGNNSCSNINVFSPAQISVEHLPQTVSDSKSVLVNSVSDTNELTDDISDLSDMYKNVSKNRCHNTAERSESSRSCAREYPPTLTDCSSLSALLPEELNDNAIDHAFPRHLHSKGMPEWISRHLTPVPKHKISVTHNELLDEYGRPAWLSKKQRFMFDQLLILKYLEDDLDFDAYDCRSSATGRNVQYSLLSQQFVSNEDVNKIVSQLQRLTKSRPFVEEAKHTKRKPWDQFKNLFGTKQGARDVDQRSGDAQPSTRLFISSQMALIFIDTLQEIYLKCIKEIVKWSLMDYHCDSSHLPSLGQFLSQQNTNQSANLHIGDATLKEHRTENIQPPACTVSNYNNNANEDGSGRNRKEKTGISMTKTIANGLSKLRSDSRQQQKVVVLKELGPTNLFAADVLLEEDIEERVNIQPHLTQSPAHTVEPPSLTMDQSNTIYNVLLHYSAEDIAREITLIDRALLIRLEYKEMMGFINGVSTREIFSNYRPLAAIIKLSERFHNFFVSEILRCKDEDIQIEVIQHLIAICDICVRLDNYNCLWVIIEALTSHPIQRLNSCWAGLKRRYLDCHKTFNKLRKLTDTKSNYRSYHECLQKAVKSMENKPHILFFGIYLQRLLQIKNRSLDYYDRDVKSCNTSYRSSSLKFKPEMRFDSLCANKAVDSLQEEMTMFNNKNSFYAKLIGLYVQEEATSIKGSETLMTNSTTVTQEEKKECDTNRRQLLLHQLSTVHYDFQSNTKLRSHLLRTPYNSEIQNYISSFKLQPVIL